ncbi:winged helix DNA-binding protein [Pseudomonas monteilii]|uniref:winged helix DNA-binding protein n=1 Tax=Pseudomonas monteilii TaxID=76759 RepID=UPI000F784B20
MIQMETTSRKQMPISNSHALDQIIRAFKVFREIDPEMQLKSASLFIHSALNPGSTMAYLQQSVGITQESCSRAITAFSEWRRHERPGHGLLATAPDPMDRRKRFVQLTEKGEQLVASLEEAMMNPVRQSSSPKNES